MGSSTMTDPNTMGDGSEMMGNDSEMMGNDSQMMGNDSEMMGNDSEMMGNDSEMMGDDKLSELVGQLSDKDREAVEAYAESLLSKDETNNEETPDNNQMPMNETVIFKKEQLNKIFENFGATNDVLDKKPKQLSNKKRNAPSNSPFNAPNFN